MDVSDFDFSLPPALIAQQPAEPRGASRLLHVGETLDDRMFAELPLLLRAGDLLVMNDTRVIPAQLAARRGAARIGITLNRRLADGAWHVLARNARRLSPGDTLRFEKTASLSATVLARHDDGGAELRFNAEGEAFEAALREAGALALPPYIERAHGPTARDATDYQTVYARENGAVAAPTAGLHFTPDLLAALRASGIRYVTLTLHVGAGTFLPMRADHVAAHTLHAERGILTPETAAAINETRARGGRVVAVGTTSLRLMETACATDGTLHPFDGETEIFIMPGDTIRTADLLLTNFHLPRSTLFMLVCAFAGTRRMRDAYAHAIAGNYRFFSYGDSSLLERAA